MNRPRPADWSEFAKSLDAPKPPRPWPAYAVADFERHSRDMFRPAVRVSHVEGMLFSRVG